MKKAIVATGLPIYLDNGLFENKEAESINTLVKKAVRIGAELVFAPDVLYDVSKTRENVNKAANLVLEAGLKLGAVVQADNKKRLVRII